MPFLTASDLRCQLYDYQLQQITDSNAATVAMAISSAIAEVRSYLANRFNCDAIFSASVVVDPSTGSATDNRDPLVLQLCCAVAAFRLVKLANCDAIYDRYRADYDDAIAMLRRVADGTVSPSLPYRSGSSSGSGQGSGAGADDMPPGTIQLHSNNKFNHDF